MKTIKILWVAVLLLATGAGVHAELITAGNTALDLTSYTALTNAGLTVLPLGTATVTSGQTQPTYTFPVTGGSTAQSGNILNHEGSGLGFTNHSNFLFLTNFVIDTQRAVMSGDSQSLDVFGRSYSSAQNADLFTLQPVTGSNQSYRVLFNHASAKAFNAFATGNNANTTDWNGTELGIAHLSFNGEGGNGGNGGNGGGPNPVPEPGTLVLLSLGLAGLVGAAYRRS